MTGVPDVRRGSWRTGTVAFTAVLGLAALGVAALPITAAEHSGPAGTPGSTPVAPAAAAATRLAADDGDYVLRVYKVGDLLHPSRVAAPDGVSPPTATYPRYGGGGGSGGSIFGPDATPRAPETALATLVRELVAAPGSWTDTGGRGAVTFAGTRMLVRQRLEAQREVEAVLAALRDPKSAAAALVVEGWWVLLPPADAAAVLGPADAPHRQVDPAALAKLPPPAVAATVTVRCRSGASAHGQSGDARSAVIDLSPTVDGPNTFDPEVARLLYGATLSVTPTVQGDVAEVDVMAAFSQPNDPAAPAAGRRARATMPATRPASRPVPPPTHFPATIDRIDVTVHHVATSARLPLGKPVVVGAMTLHPRVGGQPERQQLVFIMRVRAE